MARERSKFSTNAAVGGHVFAVVPDRIYVETGYERARRTYRHAILHSFWHVIWIAVCGILAAAVVAAVTVNSADWITAGAITLIGGLAGLGLGLGTSFLRIWVFAPRDQRNELRTELFEVRGQYDALLAELNRPAQLVADVRLESSPNDGGPLLRLDIRNEGSQPLPPGELLSIIYPAAWETFEGCNPDGLFVIGGPSIRSDEDLPDGVSARLWTLELQRPLVGGRTHLFYFRVRGVAGRHALFVRIEKLNKLFSVDLPEDSGLAIY